MRTLLTVLLLTSLAFPIEPPREDAPRFRARTLAGEEFHNDSLKGKVVLIQFWTTWCRYCRADQPSIERLVTEYPENKLVVLAVSVNESRGRVRDYLKQSPRKSKIVLTEDTNLAAAFQAGGFPYYVVLDAKGRIAGRQEGAGGDAIRELLVKAGLE